MYNDRLRQHSGFTIVELLVVIVVIAILATLSVVAYNGIQVRAGSAALKSDLSSAARQLGMEYATNEQYPGNDNVKTDNPTFLKKSGSTAFQYTRIGSGYCLTATSDRRGVPALMITHDNTTPREGVCAGHVGSIDGGGNSPAEWTVTTLVGDGVSGGRDGTGTEVQLRNPFGIVVGDDGTLYTTETGGRVRRITPAGVATTIAGATAAGYVNATGAAARFSSPTGVVIAPGGALLVSDRDNNISRQVMMNGAVSTFAGTGVRGSANGPITSAQFYLGIGNDLTYDSQGNLYASDSGNSMIRKITPAGTVSTFTTCSGVWSVCYPEGLTADSSGNIYVANRYFNRIDKIAPDGQVTRLAGGGASGSTSGYQDGNGDEALFRSPSGVAADTIGNIYVADYSNHRIRKITPSGQVTTVAGSGTEGFMDGTGENARFSKPYGIGFDAVNNNIYVADWGNQRIRKISLQ
jgi:prepilin-type N-terminal cleavage/methylation domain-containing protein